VALARQFAGEPHAAKKSSPPDQIMV